MNRLFPAYLLLFWTVCAAAPSAAQSFSHDPLGRLTEARYDATHRIHYSLDVLGNMTNVVVPAAQGETETDGDALPDAWEWVYFNSTTNTAVGDPNLNGKDNLWEYQNGYDPLDPDTDDDGAPNADELLAGTDPLNASSLFRLKFVDIWESFPVVEWSSVTEKRYRVAISTNLATGFTGLQSDIEATPPLNVYTDNTAVGAGPWFYRIELE